MQRGEGSDTQRWALSPSVDTPGACGDWASLLLRPGPHRASCKARGAALPCPPPSPAPSSFSDLKTWKLRPKEVTARGWAQGLGFPPRLVGTTVTSAGNVPALCLT